MASATSAQNFIAKLMASPQNRALATEADRIRGLLSYARQLQPGDPKHDEYRGMLGHILFTRVQPLVMAATMFDPIFLSAGTEMTSICKDNQWISLPNWQNIREDDPRIEKHTLIHKTWYVHANQQMLQALPEGAQRDADPLASTTNTVPPADNAFAASSVVTEGRLHAFGPMSQAHAKGRTKDVEALPAEPATRRGRPKKRGISESDSRTPLAEGGSHKRICANTRSNTTVRMVEDVPKGVIYVQKPDTKTDSPAGSSKATGSSANLLAGPSGAVGTADSCARCDREGKTCRRAVGKSGPLSVCTECKRLKVKCQFYGNQPSRQQGKLGVRGEPRSLLPVRTKSKSTGDRSPSRHRRSLSADDDRRRAKSGMRCLPRSRSARARARSTSTHRPSPPRRCMNNSVVQRRPLMVMSYVEVPQLRISAPESPVMKLRSMERKMSSMEDMINILHREVETLRTIIEASCSTNNVYGQ